MANTANVLKWIAMICIALAAFGTGFMLLLIYARPVATALLVGLSSWVVFKIAKALL